MPVGAMGMDDLIAVCRNRLVLCEIWVIRAACTREH